MTKLPIINYKPEIDCLRAIAIFLVILFHFELFMVRGGFIGVDIFFVISGYLITNLIIKDIKENKFSLIEFYARRLRRVIPALYSTIFVVIILSYFILSPDHFNRIGKSSISAASAYSNFFFGTRMVILILINILNLYCILGVYLLSYNFILFGQF